MRLPKIDMSVGVTFLVFFALWTFFVYPWLGGLGIGGGGDAGVAAEA